MVSLIFVVLAAAVGLFAFKEALKRSEQHREQELLKLNDDQLDAWKTQQDRSPGYFVLQMFGPALFIVVGYIVVHNGLAPRVFILVPAAACSIAISTWALVKDGRMFTRLRFPKSFHRRQRLGMWGAILKIVGLAVISVVVWQKS